MSTRPHISTLPFVLLSAFVLAITSLPAQVAGGSRGIQDVSADNSSSQQKNAYYALLIGNAKYQSMKELKTPRADVTEIAEMLRKQYGFETKVLYDASRAEILDALQTYRETLSENASLLIYYAGHGWHDAAADEAYWFPVEAHERDNSDWISMDDITSRIRPLASKHVLIISDSCYSGAMLADDSAGSRGGGGLTTEYAHYLDGLHKLISRDWMASGSLEPVADEGAPGHSIFAAALLQGLDQMDRPQFSAGDLFQEFVRRRVAGSSDQMPQYGSIRHSGDQLGDFVFVRKGAPATAVSSVSVPPAATPSHPSEQGARNDVMKKLAPNAELCYFQHEHGTLNDTEYVTCLQAGVDVGQARSMVYLGQVYLIGGGGLHQDHSQAVSWYRKAANLGDALGMINLAWAYEEGNGGLPKDQSEALRWYKKAAATGDPGAMYRLGNIYRDGEAGLQPDKSQAMNWYQKAADAGNSFAMRELGDCYVEGSCGVPKDLKLARSWFEKAATLGDRTSMTWLANRYEEGSDGFPKDHAKAQEWRQKAAEDPHQKAVEAAGKLKN